MYWHVGSMPSYKLILKEHFGEIRTGCLATSWWSHLSLLRISLACTPFQLLSLRETGRGISVRLAVNPPPHLNAKLRYSNRLLSVAYIFGSNILGWHQFPSDTAGNNANQCISQNVKLFSSQFHMVLYVFSAGVHHILTYFIARISKVATAVRYRNNTSLWYAGEI